MTYNATELSLIAEGRLFCRDELEPRSNPKRSLLVTPEINALLDGAGPLGFPNYDSDVIVGYFVRGWLLNVSLAYVEGTDPHLERLDPPVDEVWCLCVRTPAPGWRFMGRFLRKNTLVLLSAYDRRTLGSRENYQTHALKVPAAWDALFPGQQPLRGQLIDDYIGGTWRDANESID
ncbi:hypothetical protein HLH33_18580 [Gluconacetobacter diazotrophicus]|uniref:Uncharacterized protein n=1 Tax=Gluconacetobacter diazotrophicus TaxID=33996 RepID=A0A7W4I8Q8_GLUDI|nr:hypothetical protein [Gluconacetobacter diazotrophicus]MBB2158272.1 hypothetical protein [Gluconacetobacter diazotrophicus]